MSAKMAGKYFGVPVDLLATPRDGEVIVNRHWATKDGNALFYKAKTSRGYAPQCNANSALFDRARWLPAGFVVVHMPVAFLGSYDEQWGCVLTGLRDVLVEVVE